MKKLIISLLLVSLLSACGTLEVGVETGSEQSPEPTQTATISGDSMVISDQPTPPSDAITATPDSGPTDEVQPTPVPDPISGPSALQVVFADSDHNVNLWREGEGTMPLTTWGGASQPKISDDGAIVAFVRGGELWMVRSDGTDERQLVAADVFAQADVSLYRFEWIPGTHTLAFNTTLNLEHGLALSDDLHLVDAETLEQTLLLSPGDGGEFYYSPDGTQIAVVTAESEIVLYDADGGNQRRIFGYTPVSTASEFLYYAEPVWAADSSALYVAIAPPDPYAQSQATTIYRLSTDLGSEQQSLMGTLEAARMSDPVFSPDLTQALYLQPYEEGVPVGESGLTLVSLDEYRVGESVSYNAEASFIYGWSPDSSYFAFLAQAGHPTAMIGRPGADPFPVLDSNAYGSEDAVIDVQWVDNTRYLFLVHDGRGWDILLGELFQTQTQIVGSVVGPPPSFDFTN